MRGSLDVNTLIKYIYSILANSKTEFPICSLENAIETTENITFISTELFKNLLDNYRIDNTDDEVQPLLDNDDIGLATNREIEILLVITFRLLGLVATTTESAVRYTVSGNESTKSCPHGSVVCVSYQEGMTYVSHRDMRVPFLESQERCVSLKQELKSRISLRA